MKLPNNSKNYQKIINFSSMSIHNPIPPAHPRSTRKDGLSFLDSTREKGEGGQPEKPAWVGRPSRCFKK
jgi:hypothetical protein